MNVAPPTEFRSRSEHLATGYLCQLMPELAGLGLVLCAPLPWPQCLSPAWPGTSEL